MRSKFLTVLGAIGCIFVLTSCGSARHTQVAVPSDCKVWLSNYFAALKARDVAKVKELASQIPSYEANKDPRGADFMRGSKANFAEKIYQRTSEALGDFRDYTVVDCKISQIGPGSLQSELVGTGQVTDIVCDTSYSKKSVKEQFVLFKGSDDYNLVLQTHKVAL